MSAVLRRRLHSNSIDALCAVKRLILFLVLEGSERSENGLWLRFNRRPLIMRAQDAGEITQIVAVATCNQTANINDRIQAAPLPEYYAEARPGEVGGKGTRFG